MSVELAGRRLDVDLLARELGNWRTASASGPAYQGLSDGLRMLIVDGRLPVGAQLPSERALADALRVSRTTVTAAYTQMREDGYLSGRQGARSTTALPVSRAPPPTAHRSSATASAQPRRRDPGRARRRRVPGLRRGRRRRSRRTCTTSASSWSGSRPCARPSPKDIAREDFPPNPTRSW